MRRSSSLISPLLSCAPTRHEPPTLPLFALPRYLLSCSHTRAPVVITGRNPVGGRYDDAWSQHAGRWRRNSAAIRYRHAPHPPWRKLQAHRLHPDALPRITGLHPPAKPGKGVATAFSRSLEPAYKTLQWTSEKDRELKMSTPPNQAGHASGNHGRYLLTEGKKP